MNYSENLKKRLKLNAKKLSNNSGIDGTEYSSAFIFNDVKMNFNHSSYLNIIKKPKWKPRLLKKHNHFNDGTLEMQSSNSSDALLMNIFCYPKFKNWKGPSKLLRINTNKKFEFGWNPNFDNENQKHKTEIDLKVGKTIFEAKLTEANFTKKRKEVVESYVDLHTIFEKSLLCHSNGQYTNYQLIRNILTAYKYGLNFTLLIDDRRIDLIKEFIITIKSIKSYDLRKNLNIITWQEIIDTCGEELKSYISKKYF